MSGILQLPKDTFNTIYTWAYATLLHLFYIIHKYSYVLAMKAE